ncbi:unnamed protein product [Fraxinus pennsylvanica]|uniref:Shugoshin C-terminal domain-containing protein n=1 Tax=Fraxinus pennsylvanica TaxID=56036 RepID=A0AAD1ZAJ1_9LAMI|nr:unnamed protein product [Fraxinus pennsylvanica]
MEGFVFRGSENSVTVGDKLKGEKTTMPCPGSVARRKLADISNVPQKSRPSFQDDKPQPISRTTKEYIDQLQKEHLALVTMLAQRNKIIEQSGIELERLRVNLIKMQEQNQQFALSNTQMLAELNSVKDRLRALQHELGCKNGLLRARQLQLAEKAKMKPCQDIDAEVNLIKYEEPGESLKEDRGDKEPRNTRKRSQSYCSSEQVQSKDKAAKKRSSLRRQSSRFKAKEKEPAEDLFEIHDARFPVCSLPDDPVLEDNSVSVSGAVNNKVKECISATIYEPQQFGRSSFGRPSRQAAKKELNSGKDRLRALQHELGCKNGLLRARQLQLEEKSKMKPCQDIDAEVNLIKYEEPGESLKEDGGDKEPRNTRKRSQSYCSSEQVQSKDKAVKKRSSLRRQSSRFKAEEKEPAEDLFEIHDARFPVCSLPDDPVLEDNSVSVSGAVNNKVKECISAPIYEPQQFGRSSLGRPSRQAAKKVQSYKEIPLNVKMRRI